MADDIILEMKDIVKTFPGVKALDNVSFSVRRGEIHCLVGENGAGKSTLMKVLSGVYPHPEYKGDIILNGKIQQFRTIKDSEHSGISIIYQELALIPEMTVYDNIFLGHEFQRRGLVKQNETIRRSEEILKKVRLSIHPDTKIKDLGVGRQQLVEIAKALSKKVKILILDEPTAALNEDDSDNLLRLLRELKNDGVTSILISHKLKEVLEISDTVTVLRDGKTICTMDKRTDEITEQILIKHMVGREIDTIYPKRNKKVSDEVILEVTDWSAYKGSRGRAILKNMNFTIKKGEIVGFAGLMGSGRTELARSLFGNPDNWTRSGKMVFKNKTMMFRNPGEAIAAGMAYASEDRKGNGLILMQDIRQNITIANLKEIARHFVIDENREVSVAVDFKNSLKIKAPSIAQKVLNLSGGNQQKVSIAKWMFVKPDLLILDEPTRGIDVGAKYEIYTLMNTLVESGMSILMISSELPEVLGMSDRIYIVSSGTITGELNVSEATQEKVMHLATKESGV